MSTPKPKDPYHHGGLREALLDGAMLMLEQGGVDALSLRAAARLAGVSAMAPYRHFADKKALLAAVATRGFELLEQQLGAADRAALPQDALAAQGGAYVAFASGQPALFRLMFGAARGGAHPALAEAGERAYRVLADRVAATADPAVSEQLTLAAWSLVHGLAALIVDGQVSLGTLAAADLGRRISTLMMPAMARVQKADQK